MQKLRQIVLLLIVMTVLFVIGVLPAAAGTQPQPGTINNAYIDGCTVYVELIMPILPRIADSDTKTAMKRGGLTVNAFLIVYDEGIAEIVIPVSGDEAETVLVSFAIDRYFGAEDVALNFNPDNDGDPNDYYDFITFVIPDAVVDACISQDTCPNGVPAGSVQGRVIYTTPAYWAPSLDATTDVVLAVGTAWWIVDAEAGFYQLEIACEAERVWVPAEALGANFDLYFYGAPLPSPND